MSKTSEFSDVIAASNGYVQNSRSGCKNTSSIWTPMETLTVLIVILIVRNNVMNLCLLLLLSTDVLVLACLFTLKEGKRDFVAYSPKRPRNLIHKKDYTLVFATVSLFQLCVSYYTSMGVEK